MCRITKDSLPYFMERFHTCSDGLVRYVAIELHSDGKKTVSFVLHVKDETLESDDGWSELRVSITGVKHYRLIQSRKSQYQVLSDGIQIGFFGDTVYFDTAPYSDEPDCEEDFLQSEAYCAGTSATWSVKAL